MFRRISFLILILCVRTIAPATLVHCPDELYYGKTAAPASPRTTEELIAQLNENYSTAFQWLSDYTEEYATAVGFEYAAGREFSTEEQAAFKVYVSELVVIRHQIHDLAKELIALNTKFTRLASECVSHEALTGLIRFADQQRTALLASIVPTLAEMRIKKTRMEPLLKKLHSLERSNPFIAEKCKKASRDLLRTAETLVALGSKTIVSE